MPYSANTRLIKSARFPGSRIDPGSFTSNFKHLAATQFRYAIIPSGVSHTYIPWPVPILPP